MASKSLRTYRGYNFEVHTPLAEVVVFSNVGPRYNVSWVISKQDHMEVPVASFEEEFVFLSKDDARRYGEKRVRAYVDGLIAEEK